ncbi:hypothetical protein DS746_p49 (plasmid) [Campylobacter jejuni]|nr:hypothetical protein DS746_p49 [Campylobacter jejuni]
MALLTPKIFFFIFYLSNDFSCFLQSSLSIASSNAWFISSCKKEYGL